MAEEPKQVAYSELSAAFSISAPLVNRFYITSAGPIIRIAFGEQETSQEPALQPNAPVHMRAAVALTAENLVQLRDILNLVAMQFQNATPQEADNG